MKYHTEEERQGAKRKRDAGYAKTIKYKDYQRRYRNSDRGKKRDRERRQTPQYRLFRLFVCAKNRAKRYGLSFSITRDDVERRFDKCGGICEITGTVLDLIYREDVKTCPYAPSLDQIVPGKGYTPDNIQIVAFWYNRMKGDLGDSEALEILNAYASRQTAPLRYYCDDARHLVCTPYSVENLHKMAADLGIKKCWYHAGGFHHYDIPKRRIAEITAKCEVVSSRRIVEIVRMSV